MRMVGVSLCVKGKRGDREGALNERRQCKGGAQKGVWGGTTNSKGLLHILTPVK